MTKRLSREEVASLGIYDFLGYIGSFDSPYIGGIDGTMKLIERLQIPTDSNYRILEIGCASGFTSCMIAKKFGCHVTGIDISEILIELAKERAEKNQLDNAHFQVANALDLPFEDNTFDVVFAVALTGLMPDKTKALQEFMRVLKPSGSIGTLDMFAKTDVDPHILENISNAMAEMLGFDVSILHLDEWKSIFESIPLMNVDIDETYEGVLQNPENKSGAVKAILRMLYHMIINSTIRKKLTRLLKIRKTVQLKSDDGYEYVGYLVFTGQKPSNPSLVHSDTT